MKFKNIVEKETTQKIVNHQKGEDTNDELKLKNNPTKGGENMKEIADKIYSDCMKLLLYTRHINAYISNIAIHIDSIATDSCDFHGMDDEQLHNIHYQYEDIIIPKLDGLNQNLQDYQTNILELENNINQLMSKCSEDRSNN